jgi:integrase
MNPIVTAAIVSVSGTVVVGVAGFGASVWNFRKTIFGDLEGGHRNGEHVSRQFARDIARCRAALGGDALPAIRLHDLRHTHATVLLTSREPAHVVSQRLGHASPVITMTVYAHVLPGSQRQAAEKFAALVEGAGR